MIDTGERADEARRDETARLDAVVRVRSAVVPACGLLRDSSARVLRRKCRWVRRLPRVDRKARLPAVARRRLHLAPADVPLAASRRRLRHRRLLRHPSRLRDPRRLSRLRGGGARTRHPGDRRPRREPHLERPPVVPGGAFRPVLAQARLVRLVGHPRSLPRRTGDLRRHRAVELDVGSGRGPVLLASVLRAPARPELRQRRGSGGDSRGAAVLARPRARRLPPRRRPVPLRARRNELREPAGDARLPAAHPGGDRRVLSRPRAARRGESMARGRRRLSGQGRRMPHGVPVPADAAALHGDPPRRRDADRRHHRADPRDPGERPVGALPAQPRRTDARDGHRRGTRLHVVGVREGSPDEAEPRDQAAARPAPRQRSLGDRAADRRPLLAAREPCPLLRRRDRDGGQHLPRRPRRRAHSDAVDERPQRRLLARRLRPALPTAVDGSRLRVSGCQRGGPTENLDLAPSLGAPVHRPARSSIRSSRSGATSALRSANHRILSHVRRLDDEVVLCVHNLARSAQPVELDLSAYGAGCRRRCSGTPSSPGSASCRIS